MHEAVLSFKHLPEYCRLLLRCPAAKGAQLETNVTDSSVHGNGARLVCSAVTGQVYLLECGELCSVYILGEGGEEILKHHHQWLA